MSRMKKEHRRTGTRKAKPTILIVSEGETEFNYFKDLKNRYRASWIEPKLSNHATPLEIISYATKAKRELTRKGLNVETWVVFDAENEIDEIRRHYREAIEKALSAGFKVANSSPNFEYWILLHYDKSANVTDTKRVESELKKNERIPDYEKPKLPYDDLWAILETDSPILASEARRAKHKELRNDPRFARPVTYIDVLILQLRNIANSPSNAATQH